MMYRADKRNILRLLLLQILILISLALFCTGCKKQASSSTVSASIQSSEASTVTSSQSEHSSEITGTIFTEMSNFPYPFSGKLPITEMAPRELILTESEALYDYKTMWQLLYENYPLFTAIREELGIDASEVEAHYLSMLEQSCSNGQIEVSDFIALINECLLQFRHIGHLYLCPPTLRNDFISRLSGIQGKYGNLASLVNNERSERTYNAYRQQLQSTETSFYSIEHGDDELIDLFPESTVAVFPDISLGYVSDIPYMQIGTLSGWTEETKSELYAFLSVNKDADNLIIDIRGNGGGVTPSWQFVVQSLITKPASYKFILGYKQGKLNLWTDPELQNPDDYFQQVYLDESWKEEISGTASKAMDEMDTIVKFESTVGPAENSVRFNGHIWLLVDDGVASAAEELVQFCKQAKFATIIGTTTGGNGAGLQPHIIALPWSGLLIYYEPFFGLNLDGTCNAITGTTPDYMVGASTDALSKCLLLIEH